jgi:hypothetical protein
MFAVKKNDKAFQELAEYAKSQDKPLKEVLLSDDHLETVSKIFYKNMPKLVRFTMKEPKFQEFYKNHREQMVSQIIGNL